MPNNNDAAEKIRRAIESDQLQMALGNQAYIDRPEADLTLRATEAQIYLARQSFHIRQALERIALALGQPSRKKRSKGKA